MRYLTVALVLLGLTGCARHVWVQPGATEAQFNRDKAACMHTTASAGDPILAAMFLPDCLKGKGWVQQRVE